MRRGIIFVTMFLALCAFGLVLAASASATKPNPDHKVTLCHRTGSATNPYVEVTVDIASSGYVKGGHNEHEQVGNGLGGDIIPAYEYTDVEGGVFVYPGKNLDTIIGGVPGAVILANGCVVPSESPSPSVSPSESPSESPSVTPTKTTEPPSVSTQPPPPAKHTSNPNTKRTASTGFDGGDAALIGGLLALAGMGSLYWARRRSA